jgi:hypothetical protein
MLCTHCRPEAEPRSNGEPPPRTAEIGLDRLDALVCKRCGQPVSPPDPTEALLRKLEALARFGLASEGRPVLAGRAEGY